MASSMAAAAVHSMPPFPLPAMPRIRPPPIPKGTPGPNTRPQPGKPPKSGLVWVDGRWANPKSRSAQHKQEIVSTQLEKALQHEVHGMNIYAYKHIRTHQVVYSLTKNMDNNKILKQLLYHGKKTVPAALRRDVWRPYFSVHFSKTPAGAMKGLRVFKELRELSALRQLSPPKDLSIATQKDLDGIKRGYDPVEWLDKTTNEIPRTKLLSPPVVGERLPKKWLARRLMNQAATSVADVAAVLARQTNLMNHRIVKKGEEDGRPLIPNARRIRGHVIVGEVLTPQQKMDKVAKRKERREAFLSIRNHERLQEIRKDEGAKADQLEQRQGYLTPKPGMVKVNAHTEDRISIEYDGVGQKLAMIDEADESTMQEIGAAQSLRQTLENIQNEKRTQRKEIETSMGAKIEQQLMQMTQAERDQIEKDVEAERAEKQTTIDAKVAKLRDTFKARRAKLYERPATLARTLALKKLSRDSQAAVYALKTDLRTRLLKWAGPFAPIATAIDDAMMQIDENWKDRLVRLREEVEEEKTKHADPANHEVEIRWANLRDGTHAKSWPDTVFHTELQPKAVSKTTVRAATTQMHYDEDEELIEHQIGLVEATRRSTVHVFGSVAPDPASQIRAKGRYESPAELLARQREDRLARIDEWQNTEAVLLRDRILVLREESDKLKKRFALAEFDDDVTQYIASCYQYMGDARYRLSEMGSTSYQIGEVDAIASDIAYYESNRQYCLDELSDSKVPIDDEARINFLDNEVVRLRLELQNPEARVQADVRQQFISLFNRREELEDSIDRFSDQPNLLRAAKSEFSNFDVQNPEIIGILARRDNGLIHLPSEIEDCETEMTRLKEEIKNAGATEDVSELKAQLQTERDDLHNKKAELQKLQAEEAKGRHEIRKVIREDKQAWLEYKRLNTGSVYETRSSHVDTSSSSQAAGGAGESQTKRDAQPNNSGMVMEAPKVIDGEKVESKGLIAKSVRGVKWMFGRGKE